MGSSALLVWACKGKKHKCDPYITLYTKGSSIYGVGYFPLMNTQKTPLENKYWENKIILGEQILGEQIRDPEERGEKGEEGGGGNGDQYTLEQ